jgi:ectoine hydroxylase-related dioxygenase (phytanoyl-CoA dioxygenase family)
MTLAMTADAASLLRADYRRDGVVKLPMALSPQQLRGLAAAFDWSVANPSPAAQQLFPQANTIFYQDLFNTLSWPRYVDAIAATDIPAIMAALWGCDNVWFFFEQVFLKQGGQSRRTPWHQDTSYFPIDGADNVVLWISLDPVVKADSLEFVRGSQLGALFNGSSFDADDDTAPLYAGDALPRLPDIEADRSLFDIVSWAVEPGDILAFHPSTLHGGAPTKLGNRRRTLSLRFFGNDAVYVERPQVSPDSGVGFNRNAGNSRDISDFCHHMKPGDSFRHPDFTQLWPAQ